MLIVRWVYPAHFGQPGQQLLYDNYRVLMNKGPMFRPEDLRESLGGGQRVCMKQVRSLTMQASDGTLVTVR